MSPIGINRNRRCKGFTLLEMLAVLAIISSVGIAAVTVSSQVSTSARLRDAAMQLQDDISLLRTQAALRSVTAQLSVIAPGNQYSMTPLGIQRELPIGVTMTFTARNPLLARADAPTVVFHPSGVTAPGQFVLEAGNNQRTVTISWPSGFARVQE